MNEWLFQLVEKHPWILTVTVVVIIIILIIFVVSALYAVKQGRSITTPLFKIGSRESKTPQNQASTQTQSAVFQNIINTHGQITDSNLDEITQRIAIRVLDLKKQVEPKSIALFNPPELPERITYIYSVRHYIKTLVSNIALNWGGHWAGASMADFGTFFDLATSQKLLSEDLANKISDYWQYTQALLNTDDIPDISFLEIQYLGADVCRQLEGIKHSTTPMSGLARTEHPEP